MQAALDDVAFKNAVAEVGHGVGAIRLGRVERSVDIVEGDTLVAHLEALDAARRKIGGRADGNGIFSHGSMTQRETSALAGFTKTSIGPPLSLFRCRQGD